MSSLSMKRVSFACIICVVILFFTVDANAQFRKGRYTLTGSMKWEYETYSFEDDTTARERVRFLQNYNINLAGNIVDPRLVTFNAGLRYWLDNAETEDSSTTSTSSDDDTSELGYNVSFSFFPRSWYPFTIYADRSTQDTASNYYPTTTTTNTSYGANMSLRLTTLPSVDMRYDTINSNTKNPDYPTETDTTTYSVNLSKRFERLWDSYVSGGYTSYESEDKTSGAKSASSTYYLNERSDISKTTSLDMNAMLNDYTSETSSGKSDSQYMGLGVGLSMQPYKRFRHNYSYNYSKSDSSSTTGSKSETTINSFGGNASYLILKEWPVDGVLRYSTSDFSDETTTTSTGVLDTSVGTSWSINKNWSTGAGLAYYAQDTSSDSGEDSSGESTSGTAGIKYTTPIRFLDFRSGYTFAYSSVTSEPGEDTKTTMHAFNAGVGTSYNRRYLSANAAYDFTYTISSPGEDGDTHSVSFDANTTYIPHTVVNASANWYFGRTKSILSDSKSNTRSAALSATNTYFTAATISASVNYSETHVEEGQISTTSQSGLSSQFLGGVAVRSSDSKALSANAGIDKHLGRFGRFSIKGRYSMSEATGEVEGVESTITTTAALDAVHSMLLTRRLSSDISVSRTETTDETDSSSTDTGTTSASAALSYRIGKWSLSATYKYILNDREESGSTYESEEHTLLFGITRTFRLFL